MNDPLTDALKGLPHGPEFRFLDRLVSLEAGRSGAGEYTAPENASFLRGHFPGQPLLPGVLLVEALAQLAGVVAQSDPTVPPLFELRLTALRSIKILGTARPGETIQLRARLTGRLANLVQAEVSAVLAGTTLLTGEISLSGKISV